MLVQQQLLPCINIGFCFRRNNVVELLNYMPKLEENSNFLVIISFDLIGVILDVVSRSCNQMLVNYSSDTITSNLSKTTVFIGTFVTKT